MTSAITSTTAFSYSLPSADPTVVHDNGASSSTGGGTRPRARQDQDQTGGNTRASSLCL